jgi:hypothetical protein
VLHFDSGTISILVAVKPYFFEGALYFDSDSIVNRRFLQMSFTLTAGGVEKLFSLSGDEDRAPITGQVLEVHCQAARKDVILSDGVHFCRVTWAKRLHQLIAVRVTTW